MTVNICCLLTAYRALFLRAASVVTHLFLSHL